MQTRSKAVVIFLAFIGLGWLFLHEVEADSLVKRNLPKKPPPGNIVHSSRVEPVVVPSMPKKSSGKAVPDTNWVKQGTGQVEGFTGVSREWWDEEKTILKSEMPYNQGKIDGMANTYYENGQLNMTAQFINDTEVGSSIKYNPDGSKASEIVFDEDGKFKSERRYHNDILVSYIFRNVEGEKHSNFYDNGKIEHVWIVSDDSKAISIGTESYYAASGALTKQIQHDGKGGSNVIYDKAKGIDLRLSQSGARSNR